MRKRSLILDRPRRWRGGRRLIYRNWRHIVRHPLKLSPATHAISVERNIPIEVEHGLTLAADHYYPKAAGRFPTILIRSPYGRELRGGPVGLIYGFLLRRLAERGYHVIARIRAAATNRTANSIRSCTKSGMAVPPSTGSNASRGSTSTWV